jgi:hypothetical protein
MEFSARIRQLGKDRTKLKRIRYTSVMPSTLRIEIALRSQS